MKKKERRGDESSERAKESEQNKKSGLKGTGQDRSTVETVRVLQEGTTDKRGREKGKERMCERGEVYQCHFLP